MTDPLVGYDDWLLHGQGGPLDDDPLIDDELDDPDDDGAVSHTGCLALLAVAWLLLAAGAWGIGAPVSSAVVDAGLAVAVSGVAAVAWLDRDQAVTR